MSKPANKILFAPLLRELAAMVERNEVELTEIEFREVNESFRIPKAFGIITFSLDSIEAAKPLMTYIYSQNEGH